METFPIPRDDALVGKLDQRISLGRTALAGPIDAIASEIGININAQEKALGSIKSRINRSLSQQMRRINGKLNEVTIPLETNISVAAGERGIQLGKVLASVPTKTPLYPPLTQPLAKPKTDILNTEIHLYIMCSGNVIHPAFIEPGMVPPDPSVILADLGVFPDLATANSALQVSEWNNDIGKPCQLFPTEGPTNGTIPIDKRCIDPSGQCWDLFIVCNPITSTYADMVLPTGQVDKPDHWEATLGRNLTGQQVQEILQSQSVIDQLGRPCAGTIPIPPPIPPIPPPVPPIPPIPTPICPAPIIECPKPPDIYVNPEIKVTIPPSTGGTPTMCPEIPACPPCPPTQVTCGGGDGGRGTPFEIVESEGEYIFPPDMSTMPKRDIAFPAIGSPEFCAKLKNISDVLVNIGNAILTIVSKIDSAESVLGKWQAERVGAFNVGGMFDIGTFLIEFTIKLTRFGSGMIKSIGTAWTHLKEAADAMGTCLPPTIIAISAVRTLLRGLENIRVGTDALIWLTVDVHFELTEIKRIVDYVLHYICQTEVPSPGEAMEAFLAGSIDKDMLDCWLMLHGCNPDVYSAIVHSRREKLHERDVIHYCRRMGYDEKVADEWLKRLGWIDNVERKAIQYLYDELPTISDHLHFLQRNVHDREYVADFRLMEGFEDKFWPFFGPQLYALGMTKEIAGLHYAAHWINPAMGQLFEMVQRLRPGRVLEGQTFTENDCLRVLVEQDVGHYFRERLMAISYNTIGLRFLRQLYDTFQIDTGELSERFQDIGYVKHDADMLAETERQTRGLRRATRGRGWSPATILWAYQRDYINVAKVQELMSELMFTPKEIADFIEIANYRKQAAVNKDCNAKVMAALNKATIEGYEIGTTTEVEARLSYINIGYVGECVDIAINTLKLRAKNRHFKKVIDSIRKIVMNGSITLQEASGRLLAAGIPQERIDQLIADWQLELTPHSKMISAEKILKWLEMGLITRDYAAQRLRNLGYQDVDTMLLIAEAWSVIVERQVKAQQAIERGIAAKRKELERLLRMLDAQKRRIQAELRTLSPVGKMQKWYKKGIISEEVMRARMRNQGYLPDFIDNFVAEVKRNGEKQT